MAAAAAEYLGAERLIYLTDVAGVLDGANLIETVECDQVEALVAAGKVSGGMVLKLEASRRALAGGVNEVRIVGGETPGGLRAAVAGEPAGTRVVAPVPLRRS